MALTLSSNARATERRGHRRDVGVECRENQWRLRLSCFVVASSFLVHYWIPYLLFYYYVKWLSRRKRIRKSLDAVWSSLMRYRRLADSTIVITPVAIRGDANYDVNICATFANLRVLWIFVASHFSGYVSSDTTLLFWTISFLQHLRPSSDLPEVLQIEQWPASLLLPFFSVSSPFRHTCRWWWRRRTLRLNPSRPLDVMLSSPELPSLLWEPLQPLNLALPDPLKLTTLFLITNTSQPSRLAVIN